MPVNHKGTATLETERLVLRKLRMHDAPAMFANWTSSAEVTRFLTWQPHGSVAETEAILRRWITGYGRLDYYQWGIELKSLGEPIGSISGMNFQPSIEAIEIGYCIGKPWWGQGIMTEALGCLISFFFDQVGMHRICADHDVNNPASGAVMRKCGMQPEGIMRAGIRDARGEFADIATYAILAEDRKD